MSETAGSGDLTAAVLSAEAEPSLLARRSVPAEAEAAPVSATV